MAAAAGMALAAAGMALVAAVVALVAAAAAGCMALVAAAAAVVAAADYHSHFLETMVPAAAARTPVYFHQPSAHLLAEYVETHNYQEPPPVGHPLAPKRSSRVSGGTVLASPCELGCMYVLSALDGHALSS